MIWLLPPGEAAAKIFSKLAYGFFILASLIAEEAALRERKPSISSGRDGEGRQLRGGITAGVLVVGLSLAVCGVSRADEPIYDIDIPSMNAADALNRFADQTGAIMLFPYDLASARQAMAVSGRYTLLEGLELLLQNTGLSGGLSDKRVVNISLREREQPNEREGENMGRAEKKGLLAGVAAAVLSVFNAQQAAGQEAGTESMSRSRVLEEIVVTAQRREENLLLVPISIDMISGADLNRRGVETIWDLTFTVPNLTNKGALWTGTYIRGVGSSSASPNNEPSVATYVDGVYSPSSVGLQGYPFNNVKRVEVLKGPQGTLFGRNATGGVIQIVTADPSHDFGGSFNLGYGNYEWIKGDMYLTGGIIDNLAADLAVTFEDQRAGWGDNLANGSETYLQDNIGVRSKWLYAPADSTRIGVAFDYAEFNHDHYNNQMLPGSFASDGVTTYPGARYDSLDSTFNKVASEQFSASVRIDQDLGALHGVSITSLRNVDSTVLIDNDSTPNDWVNVGPASDSDYVTQELHLSNRDPGKVEWLVGAFFYHSDVDFLMDRYGERLSPTYFTTVYGNQEARSVSAFGQATTAISADTRLTVGLRYTDEILEVEGWREDENGQVYAGPFTDEISHDPWTWRLALDHQFTPDILGYVSYNHGFKTGGFNLTNPGTPGFDPEEVDAYEVGLKSQLRDNRIRLSVAAFYYDYTDIQISTGVGATAGGQIFTNAAAAEIYGLDGGLDFAATEHLTVTVGLGLLDATFDEYYLAQANNAFGDSVLIDDASGIDLPNSPPFTGFFSANYQVPTPNGEFAGSLHFSYSDSYIISVLEQPEAPAYEMLNASLEWWSQSEVFGVRLWGRNLTDSYYPTNLLSTGSGWRSTYGAPRTYGLTLLTNF